MVNKPFNENFGNLGGSDSHFFRTISSRGYKIKWCDEAKAYEHIGDTRLTLKWNLMRSFRVGNSQIFALKLNKSYKKIFYNFLRSIIQIILILALFIFGLLLYFSTSLGIFLKFSDFWR